MAEHDQLVSQFSDVTGVDADQARFYLESAAWELEVALVSYYENEADERQVESSGGDDNDIEEVTPSDAPPSSKNSNENNATSKGKTRANSRFATVSSLNKGNSSDEEEGQAFYAGGSEHSGQQVLGPGKKKNNLVAEMFRAVQERGAEVLEPRDTSSGKKALNFGGTGYKLGQTSSDSEVVGAVGAAGAATSSTSHEVNVTLKMWQEGFSINDGPLRRYSDPESRDFLARVGRGEVPDELIQQAQGNEVHLNMEDHSHEEFQQVKRKMKAFSGRGNVLGSPSPNTVVTPTSTSDQDRASNEERARALVALTSGEPTTTMQIRLADGSRLVVTLNHSHTIADLRKYIVTARPEYESRNFNLLTSFPSKELSDGSKTLAEAGVLNSAILQRMA